MKERTEKIKGWLKKGQAALIADPNNRYYFLGFRSSAGTLVITSENAYFIIDSRYFEKAKSVIKGAKVLLSKNLYAQIKEILEQEKVTEVLLESDYVTIGMLGRIEKQLEGTYINRGEDLNRRITELRAVKTEEELGFIEAAQSVTDKGFEYIQTKIAEGVTEKEIALELEFFMRRNKADGLAFNIIAVSGKNSSLPHGVPTDKPLEKGDFLTLDFGAGYKGYCSDMTRTVALGYVSEEQRLVYETVLKAQKAAIEVIREGAVCCEVDKAARDLIAAAGFGDCFGHGLGHSLGIEIHEAPSCNTRDTTPMAAGTVMTVEPGIYIEGKFGVRIEDMVVVTKEGCRNLTKSPKELIIL